MSRSENDVDPLATVVGPAREPALDRGTEALVLRSFVAPAAAEDRYCTLEELGRGGLGEVAASRDTHLERIVAVKRLLSRHAKDPALAQSFLTEAKVQARLEHPAIVPLYDLGIAGEVPFLAMKRVLGTTLEEALRRLAEHDADAETRFTTRRLLAAFATICQAVDYAHSRGVIHRDLKPSNVMLGEFGEVYVLDWGVAKLLDARAPAGATATVVGTPGYMAPEQERGDEAAIDARTDVFALGAILHEILTLAPLGAPARRTCSPALLATAMHAAAPAPADRFASPRAMREELEYFLERESIEESKARATGDLVPFSVAAYAGFLLFAPLVMWMGVRNLALSTTCVVLLLLTAASALGIGRFGLYPPLVLSTAVIGCASTLYGPYVFVPMVAALNTLFFVIQLDRRGQRIATMVGCLPIVVPAVLQALGVLRPSYRFAEDAMTVLPSMHGFSAPAAPLFLLGSSVLSIVIASVLAARLRRSLAEAELRALGRLER